MQQVESRAQELPRRFQAMISTVAMLLVCLSSVVTEGLVDESSVAAMVAAMREEMREQASKQEQQTAKLTKQEQQIVKLKDALEKKEEGARKAKSELTHVQLTTGGEVVELVSACPVPGFLFLAP